MAIAGGYFVVQQLGGVAAMFENMGYVRSEGLRGLGVGTYAATALIPTVMQFWLMFALKNKTKRCRIVLYITILTSGLGFLFGFRGPAVSLLIEVACIYYFITGRPSKKQMIVTILMIGIGIALLGAARSIFADAPDAANLARTNSSVILTLAADASVARTRGVEMLVIMTDYMEHHDYHFFLDNISETMHSVIPSIVWPKGISLSEKVGTAVYGNYLLDEGIVHDFYGGVSYTLIGEGYWNFGIIGVILVCSAMGYLLKIIERGLLPGSVSYTQLIMVKALACCMVGFIEVPQLGINQISINLLMNYGILIFLSMGIFKRPARSLIIITKRIGSV